MLLKHFIEPFRICARKFQVCRLRLPVVLCRLDLLRTRWGLLWMGRSAGVALLAAGGSMPAGPLAALAAAWLVLRSFQGHAGAHGMVPALVDWLHLLAAAAWLGGLVQLALLPRPVPVAIAARVRVLATVALALLVPAGAYAAFLHVPHLHLFTESPYGKTLIAKLVLAGVLMALGAVNHFGHVPAMRRREPGPCGSRSSSGPSCWP